MMEMICLMIVCFVGYERRLFSNVKSNATAQKSDWKEKKVEFCCFDIFFTYLFVCFIYIYLDFYKNHVTSVLAFKRFFVQIRMCVMEGPLFCMTFTKNTLSTTYPKLCRFWTICWASCGLRGHWLPHENPQPLPRLFRWTVFLLLSSNLQSREKESSSVKDSESNDMSPLTSLSTASLCLMRFCFSEFARRICSSMHANTVSHESHHS